MTQGHPKAERLATGLGLAVVGGFLDTYTYFTRGGVFANAQTGNLVLLGISAARGELYRAGQYLIPVLAFALGVVATEGLRARRGAGDWQRTVLLLEAAILAVVGLLPPAFPDFVVNVTVSFLCSMQVNSFRLLEGMPYATTMCIGNLRSGMEHLYRWHVTREKAHLHRAKVYCLVILVFVLGASLGGVACRSMGRYTILICCPLLLAAAALMAWIRKQGNGQT